MKSNKISQRDAFWNAVYNIAKKDKDVFIISGDMGAPALDKFRKNLAEQFINIGIAEHNMIGVGAGMANEGKKVYTYAIAPFITSRCYEFIKINASLMKIPLKLVGVGAGFSYNDSGPTHHTTEDISIMRALPNMEVLSPSDSILASKFASYLYKSKNPSYIRLEREVLPKLYKNLNGKELKEILSNGFYKFENESKKNKFVIVSTSNMTHEALKLQKKYVEIDVIDVNRLKPLSPYFVESLKTYEKAISLEEHLLDGGLGSIIAETIVDNDISLKLKRLGLNEYTYAYGGRENVRESAGLGKKYIKNEIEREVLRIFD